ncbi:MAG: clostripain-related cysteine peptidase [Elusimicrobiota bacterium]
MKNTDQVPGQVSKGYIKTALLRAAVFTALLSPGLSRADDWAAAVNALSLRTVRADLPAPAPSRPPKAPAAVLFYLDNQNGDYVDSYIARQLPAIAELSRANRAVRWVTLYEKNALANPAQHSLELKDQSLVVSEWVNGEQVPLGNPAAELNGAKPSISNPEILAYFLGKGLSLDAQHNILVMADHGVGSSGLMTNSLKENGKPLPPVMTNTDTAKAITDAGRRTGSKVDLLVLDACLMSSIEAMTDLRKGGLDIPVVASENTTTPTAGSLNYGKTLGAVAQAIGKGQTFDALGFGATIVKLSKNNDAINLSLVNLKLLDDALLGKLKTLFAALAEDLKDPKKNKAYAAAFTAKIVADKTISVGTVEIDLLTYLEMLQKIKALSDGVKAGAQELGSAAFPQTAAGDPGKLLAAWENDQPACVSQKGLSIVHPLYTDTPASDPEAVQSYTAACRQEESLAFSALTGWDKVLKAYAGMPACGLPAAR